MQETMTPKVSVIVSSHREQFIEELISSFKDSVWESVPTEIIIVADYNLDKFIKRYPDIQWLYVPDKSISAKRNKGITSAKGDICAFIDDDCLPDEKWISKAVVFFDNHPDIVGVEGMTIIDNCDKNSGAYREYKRLESRGYRTNNIFYRRNTLLAVNLFDERFTVQREDVDLAYSIIEAGLSIGYSREINVRHRLRKNEKWDLLKNCINRRFDPLLHFKHKKLYRHFIGTPCPPGIALIFLAHLMLIFGISLSIHYFSIFTLVDIFIILFLTIRRAGLPFINNPVQWLREFISFIISPFVLFGVLIYGSIRFRHLFFI